MTICCRLIYSEMFQNSAFLSVFIGLFCYFFFFPFFLLFIYHFLVDLFFCMIILKYNQTFGVLFVFVVIFITLF